MVEKKPVDPAKNSRVQAPTATTSASVKKSVASAKKEAVQPHTTAASTSAKKSASSTGTPNVSATGQNQPVKPAGAPPIVAGQRSSPPTEPTRPKSSGGPKTGSSPQNPNYQTPLSLKKHGFRVPVFKPKEH